MANLRDLKKEVKYVCGDLAAECMIAESFIKGVDREKMNGLVVRIADLQSTALSGVNFSFDKQPADFDSSRAYSAARSAYFRKAYKSFREKFYKHVNDIVHEMNAALPSTAREAKKELAQ